MPQLAPFGTDATLTIDEDGSHVFAAADFGFGDTDATPDDFAAVVITTLPTAGTLTLNGAAVTAEARITVADIDAGLLVFTPVANASGAGYASLTFQVEDDGSAGGNDAVFSQLPVGWVSNANTYGTRILGPNNSTSHSRFAFTESSLGAPSTIETDTANQPNAVAAGGTGYILNFDFLTMLGFGTPSLRVEVFAGTTSILDQTIAPSATIPGTQHLTLTTANVTGADAGTALKVVFTNLGGAHGAMIGVDNVTLNANGNGTNLLVNGDFGSGDFFDSNLDPTPNTLTFDVTPEPSEPAGSDSTVTLQEDGSHVLTAANFGFSDQNTPADNFVAVLITSLPTAGALSLNGAAVTAGDRVTVADIDAGLLVFTPAANASGAGYASLTFQVEDDGPAADNLDLSANTLTFDVTALDDAPEGSDATLTLDEDGSHVFTAADFGFSDPNDTPADTFVAVVMTTLPTAGALTLNGAALTAGDRITVADIDAGLLVFTPAANASGTGYASLTFQVEDDGAPGGNYIETKPVQMPTGWQGSGHDWGIWAVSTQIAPVDGSAFAYIGGAASVLETNSADQPNALASTGSTYDLSFDAITVQGFGADGFTVQVFAGATEIGSLSVAAPAGHPTTEIPSNRAISLSTSAVAPADGGAALRVVFTANNGDPNRIMGFDNVVLTETGSITNLLVNGDFGSRSYFDANLDPTPNTLTFDVTPEPSEPAGSDNTVTLQEDGSHVLTAANFGFSDQNTPADNFVAVLITSLPTAGALSLNGAAVTAGDRVTVADIDAGLLVFTPAANASGAGYASLTFQVEDDGPAADNLDLSANTLTFDVTALDDAPEGSDATLTLDEDGSHVFTAADFGFSDPNDTPADTFVAVVMTTLPTAGALTLNGAAVTAGDRITVADIDAGLLVFTPAANASGTGYASLTFQVEDDGTAGGNFIAERVLPDGWMGANGQNWGTMVQSPTNSVNTTEFLFFSSGLAEIETDPAAQPNAIARAGATYELTFDVLGIVGYTSTGFQIEVFAGSTRIAVQNEAAIASTPTASSQRQASLTTSAVDPADDGAALRVKITSPFGGHAYLTGVDNMVLTETGSSTNLLVNGDFGSRSFHGANLDPTPNTLTFDVTPEPTGQVIIGTDQHDRLVGTALDDTIRGLGDGDVLNGGDGDDLLEGGDGNDFLQGAAGIDTMTGGAGQDSFRGVAGLSELDGDTITDFEVGDDIEIHRSGHMPSSYSFDRGTGVLSVDVNNDGTVDTRITLQGYTGFFDYDDSGAHISIRATNNQLIEGTPGQDNLNGGIGDDTIRGLGDNDRLQGNDGNDLIEGGAGNDSMWGVNGNDTLRGGDGDDYLAGQYGVDELTGGAGSDEFTGLSDELDGDTITDFSFDDLIRINLNGDLGPDADAPYTVTFDETTGVLNVDMGADGSVETSMVLQGFTDQIVANVNDGQMVLTGLAGQLLTGTFGNDLLTGTPGNDSIIAGNGNDTLIGLDGNDYFNGQTDADVITTGGGRDTVESFVQELQGEIITDFSSDDLIRVFQGAQSGDFAVEFDPTTGLVQVDVGNDGTFEASFTLQNFNDSIQAVADGDHIHITSTPDFVLMGTPQDDSLVGGAGDDTIIGLGDNDTLRGNDGDDSIEGGDGNDLLAGGEGNDTLLGGDGDDEIHSQGGTDRITGGAGADNFVAPIEQLAGDTITDFSLDDRITLINANLSPFSVRFNAATQEVEFDHQDDGSVDYRFMLEGFTDDIQVATDGASVILTGASRVRTINGTENSENLNGTVASEIINGLGGWDWINPGGGSDTIDGGEGRDMVSFVNLPDTPGRTFQDYRLDIDLGAGTAVNHTGSEQIQLINVERITGTIHADRIRGSDGDDQLRGSGDYDWFIATQGADTLDGGNGKDMVSYLEWLNTDANQDYDFFNDSGVPPMSGDVTGVVVDLNDTGNNTHLAAGHTYVSIERITGSGRQDVFYGDGESNDFRGLGDYDWFVGSAGGRERYFGGDGVDTVTYFRSTSGVTANLRNGATVNGQETGYGTQGDAARDLYFEIENLIGTNFDDSLTGNGGRNQLSGLDGDDMLFGYGGIDQLKGGAGNDTLNGGGSSDYAIFSGDRAEYTITKTGARSATVSSAAEGTDTLLEMEYLRFADGDVAIWDL